MKKLTSSRSIQRGTPGEQVDALASAVHVMQEAGRLGKLAEEGDDLRTAILALNQYARGAELVAKLQENRPQHVDLARSPEFVTLRDRILAALAPFPEAMAAVMRALSQGTTETSP